MGKHFRRSVQFFRLRLAPDRILIIALEVASRPVQERPQLWQCSQPSKAQKKRAAKPKGSGFGGISEKAA
jgi:hypothetical protein